MNSVPLIRRAEPGDVAAMVECDEYAQRHADRPRLIEAAAAQNSCFVAAVSGRLAGFVVLSYTFFECGFVSLVVVAREHRRAGLGIRLLAAAEAACLTPKLFASANESNIAAQALLAGAGFVRSGIIHNLDDGDPEIVYFKYASWTAAGRYGPAL